jgi:hypothetical protein
MAVEKKREPSISELEGKGLNKGRDAASEELQRIREKQSYSIDGVSQNG